MLYAGTVQSGASTHFMLNFLLFLHTALSHNGSSCFCLCFILYISDLHYHLSECYRLTLDKSPDLSPPPHPHLHTPTHSPPRLCRSSSITTSQHERAEQGVAPLRGSSSSLISLLLPHPPIPRLRQCDICGGMVYILGSPCSFWRRNTGRSGEQAGGTVVEGRH